MIKKIAIIFFYLNATLLFSQQNARNGYTYSPTGEIRLFVVFADVVDDTISGDIPQWAPGEIPAYADKIVDINIDGSLVSCFSKYYKEASFGTLNITGDYYPHLLKFKSSDIVYNGLEQVIDSLNLLPGNDILYQAKVYKYTDDVTIEYYLPKEVKVSEIHFMDLTGSLIVS